MLDEPFANNGNDKRREGHGRNKEFEADQHAKSRSFIGLGESNRLISFVEDSGGGPGGS
ncbi:hypothetical protein FQN52_001962 [Onygenales sp. PD_12]|nr:hypothetical protein FQN52_001962 [Onygenales sp. PD_12]